MKRRIFVSVPMHSHLDERRRGLKDALLTKLTGLGMQPEIFFESGAAAGMSWSFHNVEEIMRRCIGAVILGFTRWSFPVEKGELRFVSEYTHYEGAIANALRLPLLIIAERGLVERGVTWTGAGHPILFMPEGANASWLTDEYFAHRFSLWSEQVSQRCDIFLGYCSQARHPAQSVHLFLTSKLGLRVLDWEMNFAAGGTILQEIERAANLCSAGIFLFTKDDQLEGEAGRAAPRDNVVFEAGYFASAKGHDRVLVIREESAKMPADLGGSIYVTLTNRNDTRAIESALRDFVERRL